MLDTGGMHHSTGIICRDYTPSDEQALNAVAYRAFDQYGPHFPQWPELHEQLGFVIVKDLGILDTNQYYVYGKTLELNLAGE